MIDPQTSAPPRAGHGCLWGCLGVLALVFLPVIVGAGYGAWFFWDGYRHDPALRAATELVRKNGMAQMVLGDHIHVTGMEGNSFSAALGLGAHSGFVVDLSGSRGNGTLAIEAQNIGGQIQLQSLILIGPDGGHYDLLHNVAAPADRPTDSI